MKTCKCGFHAQAGHWIKDSLGRQWTVLTQLRKREWLQRHIHLVIFARWTMYMYSQRSFWSTPQSKNNSCHHSAVKWLGYVWRCPGWNTNCNLFFRRSPLRLTMEKNAKNIGYLWTQFSNSSIIRIILCFGNAFWKFVVSSAQQWAASNLFLPETVQTRQHQNW